MKDIAYWIQIIFNILLFANVFYTLAILLTDSNNIHKLIIFIISVILLAFYSFLYYIDNYGI